MRTRDGVGEGRDQLDSAQAVDGEKEPCQRLKMKIAILGTGPIGSTFALQLASHGHEVTAIARNTRLEQLQAEQAIVTTTGHRAAVKVSPELDPAIAFDLVLVTVLASQVATVLPALKASAAKTVMFMFNTFDSLAPLRDAVGEQRFAFGFPAILASLDAGKLKSQIVNIGQTTITTRPDWAKVFTEAGISTQVHPDIESWLKTHAVLVAGLASLATLAFGRKGGISWAEAKRFARAIREGFALVRRLGKAVTPAPMAMLGWAPLAAVAAVLWALSRLKLMQMLGGIGPSEPRTLIDAILAAGPQQTPTMLLIRP